MTVAESIRYLMDQRGWTVADLTRASGVARSTIDNMFSRGTGITKFYFRGYCRGVWLDGGSGLEYGECHGGTDAGTAGIFHGLGRAYRRTKTDRRGSGAAVSSDKAVTFYNCREMSTPAANGLPEFQSVAKPKIQRFRREEGCGREPSGFLSRVDSETSLHRERLSEKTLSSLQTCSAWRNALFRQAEGPLHFAAAQ